MDRLLGTSLGRYRLDTLLGEGGMGAVFKAHDITLQRDVAVKIMHPQFARTGNFRERFLLEARTAARLNFPNIVQVHDFGQEKDLLYIVMEFIPGANLQQMLQDLRSQGQWLSLSEAVDLLRQVALAVDYVHRHGVLHRDLKPANIMLKPEPSEVLPYQPVITDLGLARLLEGQHITQDGTSLGTPSYMSPEQAMGEPVDARSDVYSLGILLYELAVGQLPFPIKSLTEAIRYHTKEPPPPPRSLRPDLPVILEKVILKALEKDPNQRIPNAAELAKGLKAITPQVAQATSSPTLMASSVSLVTQYQQSLLAPRGTSLIQEFAPPPDLSEDRIQILSAEKTTITVAIKRGGMLLGRDAHCDIVLDDTQASRSHARLEFDGVRYTVTDLGSTNGTFLDNAKILPGIAEEWLPEKHIRIGTTYLRLLRAEDQGSMAPIPGLPVPGAYLPGTRRQPAASQAPLLDPARMHASVIGGRASLYLPENRFKVDPGGVVVVPLTLFNQGSVVDHFRITIDGFPPSWLQGQPPVVQLMPGGKQELSLSIQPPLSSRSRAGDYPLILRASSQENPQDAAEAKLHLTVSGYTRFTSDLHPQRIRAGGAARLTVQNQGNRPVTFNLAYRDRAEEVTFTPATAQLTIPEGQSGAAEFTARPRMNKWLGPERVLPYTANIAAETGETQSHSGEVVARPRLPAWAIPVLLTLCFLLAGGAAAASWFAYSSTASGTATAQAVAGLQTSAAQTVLAEYALSVQFAQATQTAAFSTQVAGTAAAESTQQAVATSAAGTALAAGDEDNDGLSNAQEAALGTLPNNPDTDSDGLNDGAEVNQYSTNPKLIDTDGDTLSDGKEVEMGTSPLNKDTDGDGLQDNVDPDPIRLPTSTPAPPPDGVSMNCDNTYQRYRLEDEGSGVRVVILETWEGGKWKTAWSLTSDPAVSTFDLSAGLYSFGTCTKLLIVPQKIVGMLHTLELDVYAWNGTTAVNILDLGGVTEGTWKVEGEFLVVTYELNSPPCYIQSDFYKWITDQFIYDESTQVTTYTGTPPSECVVVSAPLFPIQPIFLITPLPILPIFPIQPISP